MHETGFSFSNLETPAAAAALSPGWHQVRGWIFPKPGGHFVDVRACVAGRIFAGVHGFPRADLAAHFGTARRYALAEFRIAVEFPPGAVEVTLEALGLDGIWTPFQTAAFTVAGTPASTATPATPRPLRWHDFGRGLNFLLRTRRTRGDASWPALADELASELDLVQDRFYPPEPFVGHADEPAAVNRCRFGLLPVVGYLFHRRETIARLWATTDLQALQPLRLGRVTANLVPHFPGYPIAAACGYEGYVEVPLQLPNPAVLRLYAELPDGSLHLVHVRVVRRHDAELDKFPYVAAAADGFDAATAAWRTALSHRGFTLAEDEEFAATVARLRASVAAESAPHPRPAASTAGATTAEPRRIVFVSHNLNLEGAPLFLLDLARHHAANGAELTIVSAADGVLRERFAALGARVALVDAAPVFRADNEATARAALAALGRAFAFRDADVVITNTFTTFWAVHAAKAAHRRVLSYVHESTSPAAFYGGSVAPAVLALADSALELADAVTFTSEATRRYHAWPGRPIHAVVTPGWVDLDWIDAWRARHPRAALRETFGVAADELLVTNIGTVCDRKGQVGFARAVDLFNRRYPTLARRTRFLLLGGRDSPFDDFLRDILADLALPNLAVHRETPDFHAYYAAADLTVCSSHEESSPRVVFEAMACGAPLLGSDIAGIREIARDGEEATLVPPGHTTAWADALGRVLSQPDEMRARTRRARQRVETVFAARQVLPLHAALAREVAAGRIPS